MAVVAPAEARPSAMAKPIPRHPPVTIPTLPERLKRAKEFTLLPPPLSRKNPRNDLPSRLETPRGDAFLPYGLGERPQI